MRRIEGVAAPRAGSSRDGLPRQRLRPNLGAGPRRGATAFLQPLQLGFELLIAVLQLLDHARELADLGFEPFQAKDHIRAAGLSRSLVRRNLRIAFAGYAFAPPKNAVEQVKGPVALLRLRREGDPGRGDHR